MKHDISKKVENRLVKILQLARHGKKGEKVNAELLLTRQLKKYGLKVEDLEHEEELELFTFKFKGELEFVLLGQTIAKMWLDWDQSIVPCKKKGVLTLMMPRSRYMETDLAYKIYKREMNKVLKEIRQTYRGKLRATKYNIDMFKEKLKDLNDKVKKHKKMQKKDELNFVMAFVHKNEIYGKLEEGECSMSNEDLQQIANMMAAIDVTVIRKAIGAV